MLLEIQASSDDPNPGCAAKTSRRSCSRARAATQRESRRGGLSRHDHAGAFSFFAGAYAEPMLLRVAYAYEQATKRRTNPRFLPSIYLGSARPPGP